MKHSINSFYLPKLKLLVAKRSERYKVKRKNVNYGLLTLSLPPLSQHQKVGKRQKEGRKKRDCRQSDADSSPIQGCHYLMARECQPQGLFNKD